MLPQVPTLLRPRARVNKLIQAHILLTKTLYPLLPSLLQVAGHSSRHPLNKKSLQTSSFPHATHAHRNSKCSSSSRWSLPTDGVTFPSKGSAPPRQSTDTGKCPTDANATHS